MLNSKIEKLQILVDEANTLVQNKDYFSQGNIEALEDMIGLAQKALDDDYALPFNNCREFYNYGKEEAIDFATKRYTMVPSYDKGGKVYATYGLEDSITWFKTRDARAYSDEEKALIVNEANDFLKTAKAGAKVGQYPAEKIEAVQKAVADVENAEDVAKALIQCQNKVKEARQAQVYQSDLSNDGFVNFTKDEFVAIIEEAKNDEVLKTRIAEILEIADLETLEDAKYTYNFSMNGIDYADINAKKAPWSSTEHHVSFCVAKDATEVAIKFLLPAINNEADGLGHVWVDNIDILSANDKNLVIPANDFSDVEEFNKYWKPIVNSGSPELKIDKEMFLDGSGSMYICNPTAADEGGFECTERFAVKGDTWYSLDFFAKIDGKLKSQLEVTIEYYNEKGENIGEFKHDFDKKAWPLECVKYGLDAQCNALSYWITGDMTYAEKSKYQLLTFVNNFCQGTHHWLMYQLRPEGSDAYGAVQGGRILTVVASTYAYIRNLGVFTDEEREYFYNMIDYLLRYMIDLRDRTELSYFGAQQHSGNWQTDMCIGTSMVLAVMPDFPNRKSWMQNSYFVLKGQLTAHLNDDGSWPESTRYNHAVLKHFTTYGQHILFETGENWFTDTRVCEIFNFLTKIQTPQFNLMDNGISTPTFGDHQLGNGFEFAYFGNYINLIAKSNKPLADRMYATWVRAGSQITKLHYEGIVIESIQSNARVYKPTEGFELELKSCVDVKDSGIYIFRDKNEDETENFLAAMSSPRRIAHGHMDQGAIIMYYHNTPIVMDTGIEGYFDATTMWHLSSYSHSCLLFSTKMQAPEETTEAGGFINLSAGNYSLKHGYNDTPRMSKVLDVNVGGEEESISIEIENVEGFGTHQRDITFNKVTGECVINDTVKNFEDNVKVSFPIITENSYIEGNAVYSKCLNDITLKIEVTTPYEKIEIDKGRIFDVYQNNQDVNIIDVIRVTAKGTDGVCCKLTPMKNA